ncbi:ABC transporter ATP-binding protein [Arthrobacter sp. H5]|uniref:ABC transporter ATP-binding protein n=1 Tax=Arthrobacter sp. H5 TaxID=1267973 RepID=UPI0004B04F2A|nr:ABC transporter ATP-binding protein [Arthrobacter sp. H5]
MSSSLSFTKVSRNFGHGDVLRDISLTVPQSACVALLGASGSGKSTLLRIAAGLDAPSAGEVLVDGQDLSGVPAEERGIALVFQKPLLFPHLNVLDNVAFSARMSGQSKRASRSQALAFLNLVQLADFAHRAPGKLSGGQEQRVSLARALARNPRILLLDEPFSSLDSQLREDMYALVDDIRSQLAPTIVLVTHDRREASVLADSIAVLDEGRILQHGPVAQVHYKPATLAVNRTLGGLNEIPGHVSQGCHVSPFGRIPVQPDASEGPGFLVLRQEALHLVPIDQGAVNGTVTDLKPMGAHTLVRLQLDTATDGSTGSLAVEVVGAPDVHVGGVAGISFNGASGWTAPG